MSILDEAKRANMEATRESYNRAVESLIGGLTQEKRRALELLDKANEYIVMTSAGTLEDPEGQIGDELASQIRLFLREVV